MAVAVDRRQVLAYRLAAHGLSARATSDPRALTVLDLGFQDAGGTSARVALAARLAGPVPPADLGATGPTGPTGDTDPAGGWGGLALAWTHRGAPHLHRAADLPALAAALWPRGDADAAKRLGSAGRTAKAAGLPPEKGLRQTAEAVRAVLTGPMTKGELSRAVTERIPAALSVECRGCGSTHVNDQLLRLAALPGGARHVPGSAPLTFVPIESWPGVPARQAGTATVVDAYLRLLGPAGPAEAAGFLGTTRSELGDAWPTDLTEISIDGSRPAWLPAGSVAALLNPPEPAAARLLPPSDPYLQARDRDLPLPDRDRQKALYRILGNPGAVLVAGEIVGLWRPKASGRRVELNITAFTPLKPAARAAVEAESERVGASRGASSTTVRYEPS
ncbi:MAG: DNA glycosylase AlkZ-like family protein [Frankia sp.]